MKSYYHVVHDVVTLELFLDSLEIRSNTQSARSVLVQVFSSQTDKNYIESIIKTVYDKIPAAILVGTTTAGEIIHGSLMTGSIVLSVLFFDHSVVYPIALPCSSGSESETGQRLIREIGETGPDVAGVLLFATTMSINMSAFFKGMSREGIGFPVFGGGAGIYNRTDKGFIFCGETFMNQGVTAVVFSGRNLQIYARSYLGWKPLSKEMTITDADGMLVKSVDNVCAFDIYHRYLDIEDDKEFFDNVLEFPFLLERDGETVVRVPSYVDEHNGIYFISDLETGEKCRIGYGDPEIIIRDSKTMQKEMSDFDPDAIFLYSCICRRFLMQSDVNFETYPYEAIAPTAGFYTYGEFYGHKDKVQYLNSSIVIAGMREGGKEKNKNKERRQKTIPPPTPSEFDPYSNKHNRIVSRLLHFIKAVTSELEQANKELTRLSTTDKLTQINNRLMLDDILQSEIGRSERYQRNFSIILMDIDNFKHVNDNFGHITGDEVLISMANILKENVRKNDAVGRWGGDEFLIVLLETDSDKASLVAEKIRTIINSAVFSVPERLSCSFGTANYIKGDSKDKLLVRADKALYEAKNSGRNKVVFRASN